MIGAVKMANYFLLSVSNKTNLDLCIEYSLAGFTNSVNGLWTFLDIEEGDYVSFLYGARVFNLYKVVKKLAYKNANSLPPWPPITFKTSGKTYYFPFRLYLKQERILNEPMVRPEFAYVAENLLLRGGYRRTHFQADTVTFYNVSGMGCPSDGENKSDQIKGDTFIPKIVFKRAHQKIPERFYFQELILQPLLRKYLSKNLKSILEYFNISGSSEDFEVLGEKALPEGYVDIFIKRRHPTAINDYILVEVKTGKATKKDIGQILKYVNEFGDEYRGGVLIAKAFPKNLVKERPDNLMLINYSFENLDTDGEYTFQQLLKMLKVEVIE
jgi:hypothetical protein